MVGDGLGVAFSMWIGELVRAGGGGKDDDDQLEYCGGCGQMVDEVTRCGECGCAVCVSCGSRLSGCWYCGDEAGGAYGVE